jgi:phenylalanyl-tRNA synthetase beta chain
LDLRADLLVAEVDLQAVLEIPWAEPRHTPLPRLPAVSRDLSLVVTDGLDFDLVLDALRRTPAPSAVEFGVIDRYVGEGLAPGEASVTVRVMLQPFERSLTDPEIEAYRAELVRAVEDGLGIRLRS